MKINSPNLSRFQKNVRIKSNYSDIRLYDFIDLIVSLIDEKNRLSFIVKMDQILISKLESRYKMYWDRNA